MKRTIHQHIDQNRHELDNETINRQRKRHLEDELHQLESYLNNHPGSEYDPTSIELYCDMYPDAPECRIYEE